MQTLDDLISRASNIPCVDLKKSEDFKPEMTASEAKEFFCAKAISAGFDIPCAWFGAGLAKMYRKENTRGWTLCGSFGVGKTTFAEWAKYARNYGKQPKDRIRIVTAQDIFDDIFAVMQTGEYSKSELLRAYGLDNGEMSLHEHSKDLIVDDLGAEPPEAIVYGQKIKVMQDFINRRYSAFPSVKTYFTSNLSEQELKEIYGERCWSRICEMSPVCTLQGLDRRKIPR